MMDATTIWTGTALLSVAFIYWGIIRPARANLIRISFDDVAITKVSKDQVTSINFADIVAVRYEYSAIGGFLAVWVLLDGEGQTFELASDGGRVEELPAILESALPGFSVKDLEKKFEDGDVEDAIDVWKRGRPEL